MTSLCPCNLESFVAVAVRCGSPLADCPLAPHHARALREWCLAFHDVRACVLEVVSAFDELSHMALLPAWQQQALALEALQARHACRTRTYTRTSTDTCTRACACVHARWDRRVGVHALPAAGPLPIPSGGRAACGRPVILPRFAGSGVTPFDCHGNAHNLPTGGRAAGSRAGPGRAVVRHGGRSHAGEALTGR
jgi:hypothetical protein